jgi:DNA repair ATPase RecN
VEHRNAGSEIFSSGNHFNKNFIS